MRNKAAREMRKAINFKYGNHNPELQKKLYKEMKRVWKNTPRDEKHNVIV